MSRIAVTGAAGPVGRRLCALALADPCVSGVVAIDRDPAPADLVGIDERLQWHRAQLREADLDELFVDVDSVCHLAGTDPLEDAAVDHDLHTTARVLAAVQRSGVGHVIVRTSATVYGAWPDNPVPLTEGAPLRPNDDSPWVLLRVGVEDRVRAFAESNPEVDVAVLRPCVTVSEAGPDELGRVLGATRTVSATEDEAPIQFVHADDVAAAADAVRRAGATGAFNVAPDEWLSAAQTRALVGGAPSFNLPEPTARRLTAFGWRLRLAPTPPGFVPFVSHPWVVGNDRLRALGWEPTFTNDEAFVAAHDAAPWAQISPKRRQELALGVAVGAVAAVAGGVGWAVRQRFFRR